MELLSKLGWILSETALKSIDSNANSKTIIATLLNRDLREIGAGIGELHKGKLENIDHELIVLQILKIRNISAPKANESSKTAPKLLKLTLTDGQNAYSAIEMESTALSLEKTPPGTKISLKVKQLKFANSQLLLTPKNMEILGGNVEALVSKWEISRSLANQMKENRSGGAPPFIPFGQKIQQNVTNDKSFKSLQQSKQKENEENSEFNAQRQDAIAEASRAATRKTFGGGQKTLVDSNVQKIMDKGYSEEQAVTALKFARNNAEKALSNLKRREERQQRGPSTEFEPRESHENRRHEKRGSSGKGNASSDPPIAKPSTGVSLFDFLEKKIPESTITTAKTSSNYGYHNERFENNISSSFRKFDKDNSNKSQWSQQYSSNAMSSEQKSSQKYNSKSSYNSKSDYHESSPREYRGERSDRGERSERSGDRGERSERGERGGDHYRGSNYRGGEKHSYYQQQQQANSGSNYSSKPHNNNAGSMSSSSSHYNNRNAATSNQKPSNVNNGQAPYSSSSRNTEKGKYGQKPDFESRNANKDYGNSNKDYASSNKDYGNSNRDYGNSNKDYGSSYHPKSRSNNASETYQNKSNPRNISESMEKMSLKGNNQHQSYKSYDSYESNKHSQNYSSNYMPAGFQSKEANDQAKTALKTKNIPTAPKVSNWQQAPPQHPPSIPTPTAAAPQTAPIQQPIQVPVITQSAITTGPPPFAQAAPQMHPFPVMAMPAQPAVFHPYPAAPIIMQSVPPPLQQQPPGMHQLKIGDSCLAKYWEDGKFYNAKITGVSDSTYVVLFTEYGNAEEVRKNDCVPVIVPTCPTPPQANFGPPPQIQMGGYPTQKMHQQQQHSYHNQSQSMAYKGGPKRRN